MIISLLYILWGGIIQLYVSIMSVLSVAVPAKIISSIAWAFNTTTFLNNVFPVQELMAAALVILQAWAIIYGLKIMLWFLGFVPWFRQSTLPQTRTEDIHESVPAGYGKGARSITRKRTIVSRTKSRWTPFKSRQV